jgi:altronate dehydratase
VAARVAAYADLAHQAHGQARRRPTEERMRAGATTILDKSLGPGWRAQATDVREQLDEAAACSMALGLRA